MDSSIPPKRSLPCASNAGKKAKGILNVGRECKHWTNKKALEVGFRSLSVFIHSSNSIRPYSYAIRIKKSGSLFPIFCLHPWIQYLCRANYFFQFSLGDITFTRLLFHPPYMFAFSLGGSLVFFLVWQCIHLSYSLDFHRCVKCLCCGDLAF